MFRGIRFSLKRTLFNCRIVPKPPHLIDLSKAIPKSKNKVSFDEVKSSHCCVFQPLDLNVSTFLKRVIDWNKMETTDTSILSLPDCVKGMTQLDKSKFAKLVKVPSITVPTNQLRKLSKLLKPFQLKMAHLKQVVELTQCDPRLKSHRKFLLDPAKVQSYAAINEKLQVLDNEISEKDFEMVEVELSYDNWSFPEIMAAVMPDDKECVSGFSQVGHIAHFNLRSQALPFKGVIGEVLLDKISSVKTVVNKLDTIDSTYRTFQMELLAGEDNYVTQTKENGITFELDFSKVYWNSRLGTEHHRMVKDLTRNDIVFDVFAGIGPFAVPAVKNKALVFANDLNPASYESLVKNVKLNKCDTARIKCYNKDGRKFITSIMKDELLKIYSPEAKDLNSDLESHDSSHEINSISVLMNLPALAYTFLNAFRGLLCDLETLNKTHPLPTVHCYCFTNIIEADEKFNGDVEKELKHRTIAQIGYLEEADISVRHVRDVAPKKLMKCVSFKLTEKILCTSVDEEFMTENENDEPPVKSRRIEGP